MSRALPGSRFLTLARRWFEPETVANVFEPLVADWQHEWLAATTASERIYAWSGGFFAALSAAVHMVPLWIVTPPPRALAGPVLVRALSFCLVSSAVLMSPFAVEYWRIASWDSWIYLVPSVVAIPLSFIALPLAHQLQELRGERQQEARRMLVQSLAILCVTTSLLFGWVVPIANQEWRTRIFATVSQHPNPRALPKGIRELTILELLSEPGDSPRFATTQREMHSRVSLALSPLTFGAIGWMLWRPRSMRTAWAFASWVLGSVSFYQLSVIGRGAEDAYSLFTGAGFWLAHALALSALALYSIHSPNEKGGSEGPPQQSLAL